MTPTIAQPAPLWPLLVYLVLIMLLAGAILAISYFLGERQRSQSTGVPYESGIAPTGSARVRFPTEYYLIAMFFVIFDLETAFIVTWAVGLRASGWAGYAEMAFFIALLLVGLVYLWRNGALDWGSGGRRRTTSDFSNHRGTETQRYTERKKYY